MSYTDFYKRHTEKIKNEKICCEECGERLTGNVSEVCHILPKTYFKSVAEDDDNIVYLCGHWKKNCHGDFDNFPKERLSKMKVYKKAVEKYNLIKDRVKENITYKTEDKWGM